jgi:Caudovirus prohead serine protease
VTKTVTETEHDFGGYATKVGLKCSDGRTITSEAFKHMHGQTIPLVWQHGHDSPRNILGHAVLEHRENDGTYAYNFFNETPDAQATKQLVEHGDITFLSIYANQLKENSKKEVLHGQMCEVSLVLKGANPGAKIDFVRIAHSDGNIETLGDEAVITMGLQLEHGDSELTHKSFQDVVDTMNDEQKEALYFMVQKALEDKTASHSDTDEDGASEENDDKDHEEGDTSLEHKDKDGTMTRNVFEQNKDGQASGDGAVKTGGHLSHDQMKTIFADAKELGSFKKAVLAHAEDYGITNIEVLFPDAQTIDNKPEWITRKMAWVEGLLNGTRKLPFARIKSMTADLTHPEARAKGYIKGDLKKEQFFTIAQRETTPKTVYKKQKLDRDDIIDITEFDVVAWLWVEMRFMLREEIARAILVSDGREIDDPDKISETNIRPIAFDDPFYTDVVTVPANVDSDALVEAVLRNRNNYKGTAPNAYMTNAVMVDMLLAKDSLKRRFYNTKADLASALGVQEIIEVDVLEGVERDGAELLMVIVNPSDYAVGSTRGGEITTFDDFDLDYNQYKYLIETRLSGALLSPKRAQVILRGAGTLATPTTPTFNSGTGVVTIPTVTGVTYKNQTTGATLSAGAQTALASGETLNVKAVPNATYYFPHNFDADWSFTRP